ncbi:molecular chaperone DnaK [Methylolobus aquaticus]|nr:molecular chaperone DnaK [Methylolobus aquaticus]
MRHLPSSPNGGAARYRVGIDLGTSNTVVAFTDMAQGAEPSIELFRVEQLVGPGEVAARDCLPSVRYHPAEGELPAADLRLPWHQDATEAADTAVLGEWARRLGGRSHGRRVASAKSWLSHPSVDRTAAILPWGAAPDVDKVSPVVASASYLRHVRHAWNLRYPEDALEHQDLIVTIPASFDEGARALTLEAARLAGLPRVRLLEEPQAACYDWLWVHRAELVRQLEGVRVILVCDVGGGTTDFSLIRVDHQGSEPTLTRIGVGDHLMLGGDNIDLMLAQRMEAALLEDGPRLSGSALSQLIDQCRDAKERLLVDGAPEEVPVTLLGAGSRVIGGARSLPLARQETHELVLEGFFPVVVADDQPMRRRSGVVEFGLPYAADPAVTRHLAAFLAQHRDLLAEALGPGVPAVPDALLLNGGAFRSPLIGRRLVQVLAAWAGRAPLELRNDRPELAVAFGAVAYALARAGSTVQRIEGGSARSFVLLVGTEGDDSQRRKGVCLLPKGTREEETVFLADRRFSLRLGQPVRFQIYSSTDDRPLVPGELVDLEDERFVELPPLAVAFGGGGQLEGDARIVRLGAAMTEVGTLQLRCVDVDDEERFWNVEFLLRSGSEKRLPESGLHPRLGQAEAAIGRVFGRKSRTIETSSVRTLRGTLEKLLGSREDWDTGTCRAVFGGLLEGLPHRRRSTDHERVWLNLAGYTLRPGVGYPLDDWRVSQLWGVYRQGLQFPKEAQNWAEWWTLWRRIAAGLDEAAQTQVFGDIRNFIDPTAARRGNLAALAKKRSYEDMVRLAGSLERLSCDLKAQLGAWLLERLRKPGEPAETAWALGRVGARVPFHGSSHGVIPVATAESWLEVLVGMDWRKQPALAFSAVLVGRMSGDRERDIGPELRDRVTARLKAVRAPDTWVRLVDSVQDLTAAEEKRIFGEALPPGLALIE